MEAATARSFLLTVLRAWRSVDGVMALIASPLDGGMAVEHPLRLKLSATCMNYVGLSYHNKDQVLDRSEAL